MTEDYVRIVRKLMAEGFTREALTNELAKRLSASDQLILERIAEFMYDLENEMIFGEELNGIEIFLDEK
ncbi:MAG: hypothetical protein FWJ66_07505 [Caldibacillus sp.]